MVIEDVDDLDADLADLEPLPMGGTVGSRGGTPAKGAVGAARVRSWGCCGCEHGVSPVVLSGSMDLTSSVELGWTVCAYLFVTCSAGDTSVTRQRSCAEAAALGHARAAARILEAGAPLGNACMGKPWPCWPAYLATVGTSAGPHLSHAVRSM